MSISFAWPVSAQLPFAFKLPHVVFQSLILLSALPSHPAHPLPPLRTPWPPLPRAMLTLNPAMALAHAGERGVAVS